MAWITTNGTASTQSITTDSGDTMVWYEDRIPEPEENKKLAEAIRFIADKLDDEDAADELHSIADDVEVDVVKRQAAPTDSYYPPKKIQSELESVLDNLVIELGWLIDEEELPSNDYDAPRKKTKESRRLREILLNGVPQSRIPGCTPWLQDEQDNTNE